MNTRIVALILILTTVCVVHADDGVGLNAYPRFGFEPATFRLTLNIEHNKDNRQACLTYDGGQYSSSCWPVDGEEHPRLRQMYIKDLSAGEYEIVLGVKRVDGRTARATTKVCVLPRGSDVTSCF